MDSRVNGEKVYCDTWDITGNFIVIEHGEKEYSAYAHLLPGSIILLKGDKVKMAADWKLRTRIWVTVKTGYCL